MDTSTTQDPLPKKLRMSDPDLKVVLKYKDWNDEEKTKEYDMYAQNLARLSNFVDTSLSVDMKEKTAATIVFQDVTPEVFELALKYEEDFFQARSMTVEDAVKVVAFYHMYEFSNGLKLCDEVICQYINDQMHDLDCDCKQLKTSKKLYLMVDAIALAYSLDLEKSSVAAIDFLKDVVRNASAVLSRAFSSEHIKRLRPIFANGDVDLPAALAHLNEVDINSDLFPEHFVAFVSAPKLLKLGISGSNDEAIDGNYHYKRLGPYFVNDYNPVFIERDSRGNWQITDRDLAALWENPNSRGNIYPPMYNWLPVNGQSGNLRIIYDRFEM